MELTAALLAVILLATLVQYLVDIVKGIIPAESIGSVKLPPIYAAIIGIALAVLTKTDILAALGYQIEYALAGWIITGLVVSGGSAAVHELISKLRESRGGPVT